MCARRRRSGARCWRLARYLSRHGETVCEIGRGPRDERRLRGRDDSLDATRAARTALASETLSLPLPASSGQTIRQRLSRGGDRQLNRALHTVVLHRRQHDAATKDYIARRVAEGKTQREAVRLLKRYLARHLYRLLQNQEPLMT